jgi:hypothetical protein
MMSKGGLTAVAEVEGGAGGARRRRERHHITGRQINGGGGSGGPRLKLGLGAFEDSSSTVLEEVRGRGWGENRRGRRHSRGRLADGVWGRRCGGQVARGGGRVEPVVWVAR